MFENIVQHKKKNSFRGKFTKENISKEIVLPGLEGLGDIFKSKEQKIIEARAKALKELDFEFDKGRDISDKCHNAVKGDIESYLSEIKNLSNFIHGKKFNTDKFTALTFNHAEYKFHVISDGLYKIRDIHTVLDAVFGWTKDPNFLLKPQTLYHLLYEYNLHEKNNAYMSFEGIINVESCAPKEDAGEFYCVDKGEKVTAAGYTSDFITHTISQAESVAQSIESLLSFFDKLSEYHETAKQEISKLEDYNEIRNIPKIMEYLYEIVYWAIRAASSHYPKSSYDIANYIAHHCYE